MLSAFALLVSVLTAEAAVRQSEILYNGIRPASPWPPTDYVLTLDPPTAPYLASPPEVIPIDIGRQLFVDDFLIESTTLKRTIHKAEYHPENPVLKPDKPWEQAQFPTAMVFSDGVYYDPTERLFKMWYMGGYCASTCYALSKDGVHWEKPSLDVIPGTNIVHTGRRDSTSVTIDLEDKDASRRYKMFRSYHDEQWERCVHFSADGIHWSEPISVRPTGGDRNTVFYNPFRKVWVYNIREYKPFGGSNEPMRCRSYFESADVIECAEWKPEQAKLWIGADRLDPRRPELDVQPQLYALDCVAYESLILGLFTIWPGQPADRPKPNYIAVGFTRDGFHWHRPTHEAFIPVSERKGDWNWGNVQSAGGCCLVVGDKLYFYVSGRAGVDGSSGSGVCSTGLATLRRDGFASMDAGGTVGMLMTRPVTFRGRYLFVNADADSGEMLVEVLDRNGEPIPGFARWDCTPVTTDSTLQQVRWFGGADLSRPSGQPVRFRFWLRNAALYSFWVSPDRSGASYGYVAAGGPGYKGFVDTTPRR